MASERPLKASGGVVRAGEKRVSRRQQEAGEGKPMNEREPTREIKRATKKKKINI